MDEFKKDGITYNVKRHLSHNGTNGIQYTASPSNQKANSHIEAIVFIPVTGHTQQQVIDAMNWDGSSKYYDVPDNLWQRLFKGIANKISKIIGGCKK